MMKTFKGFVTMTVLFVLLAGMVVGGSRLLNKVREGLGQQTTEFRLFTSWS